MGTGVGCQDGLRGWVETPGHCRTSSSTSGAKYSTRSDTVWSFRFSTSLMTSRVKPALPAAPEAEAEPADALRPDAAAAPWVGAAAAVGVGAAPAVYHALNSSNLLPHASPSHSVITTSTNKAKDGVRVLLGPEQGRDRCA
jgi:hypothetical protein